MANSWDRQKGENLMWFSRFETYRMIGPERTLLGTINEMMVKKGEKRRNSIPNSWSLNFEKFDWKQRAEAWDDQERQKTRKENEKARSKARKARVSLILEGIDKLREALKVCNPESAKFGEIMNGIRILSEQTRLEFMEGPTVSEVTFDILRGVANGDMSLRDAAVKFNQEGLAIPKSIEIMLSKEPPEEEPEEINSILDEEELERRYEEAMSAVQEEREIFLPERRNEVQALKEELSDKDQWSE